MADREKVINGIESCIREFESVHDACVECPYYTGRNDCRITQMHNDVLELLKEQAEEIENLKQTARGIAALAMEGTVISVPRENPCSSKKIKTKGLKGDNSMLETKGLKGGNSMLDYCARESTLNDRDEVARSQTIGVSIQETYKVLLEMSSVLKEFSSIVNGSKREDNTPRDASSLWDEARLLTALAYENLQELLEIKMSII